MAGTSVKPPKSTRPLWTGRPKTGGFKPALTKGFTRLFLPVQFFTQIGRVQTRAQQQFHPSTTRIRLTDVCRLRAARLS